MRRAPCIVVATMAALYAAPLHAQVPAGTVSGRVVDGATREPLAGALITVANRSVLSRPDGGYRAAFVPAGAHVLRVRMLGYAFATESVTVAEGQEVVRDVALTPQAVGLAEVVVVGYGEQRVGDISGAVTEITPERFNPGIVVNPLQLIQSKVAGVQVVPSSNEPGAATSIVIRGQTSVNASSEPLYVIDGVALGTGGGSTVHDGRDPLNFLNPDDIASITVLRDASAAAIYGANAANGVVVIQTRSGRQGTQVSYSSSMSASSAARHIPVLDAAQFDSLVRQYAPSNASLLGTANTDWFRLVSRTGIAQEHNLSFSSAGPIGNYRFALGYLDQDGVIRGTTTERLSLGLNVERRLLGDRLDLRANVRGSRASDRFTPGGADVLGDALAMAPTQPVRDSASATGYFEWPPGDIWAANNPVAILALASDHGTMLRSVGNLQAEYRLPFLEALKATVNLGYDVNKSDRESFYPSTLRFEQVSGTGGEVTHWEGTQTNTLLEAYLNYLAPLDLVPGTIDLTAGYSYAQQRQRATAVGLQGLSTDLLGENGFPAAGTVIDWRDLQESRLISFFGRVHYNLHDRYLVSATVRRDGSSRFGPSHAWGTFPSLSLAWRITGERFLRGVRPVSELKLRASWGRTGNQAFANYQQVSSYTPSSSMAQYQFGNIPIPTLRPSAVDPNIRWEQTDSYDVGLDFGLLGQRFTGAVDWYVKDTKDLIFTVPVAAGTNLSNYVTTNIGSMRNRGIELTLSAILLRGGRRALGWTADLTAAHNANELVRINPYAGPLQQMIVVPNGLQVLQPGLPIYSFFLCRQYYQDGKPVEGSYLSLVGDTVIQGCTSNSQRRAIHDPAPKWTFGHTSYLTYGPFDFSIGLRAWLGNYVFNNVAAGSGLSALAATPPSNASTAALRTGFVYDEYYSDFFLENGSFLRLDNLTLGYTFRYRGQPVRVFGAVQNVFTITGYSGVDPAGTGVSGIDGIIYPLARTFTAGLSLRF